MGIMWNARSRSRRRSGGREVRVTRGSNNAGWWIAALVAIVAIVGVIFLMNNGSTQTDLQNARNEGAAQQALTRRRRRPGGRPRRPRPRRRRPQQGRSHRTALRPPPTARPSRANANDAAQDASANEPAPPQ